MRVPGPGDSAHIFPGFTANTASLFITPGGPSTITINAAASESVKSMLVSSNFEGQTQPTGTLNLGVGGTLTIGIDGFIVTGTATTNFSGTLTSSSGSLISGILNPASAAVDEGQVTGSGTFNLTGGSVLFDTATATSIIVGQGVSGTMSQANGTTVTAGRNFLIGDLNGSGTYTDAGGTLNLGTVGGGLAGSYLASIGDGDGTSGTLNLIQATFNAANDNTAILVGSTTGSGTVEESGGTGNIDGNGTTVVIGGTGGSGSWTIDGTTLTIGATDAVAVTIGNETLSAGTMTLNSGSLTVGTTSSFVVGEAGTGTFTVTGGTAQLENGLLVGDAAGSSGTVIQTGGTLTVTGGTTTIGNLGAGSYVLSGGTANLTSGLTIGVNGTFTQTGGVLNLAGAALNLSGAGSVFNLNGGTLQVDNTGVSTPAGSLFNFGGGTLQIVTAGNFTLASDGNLTAATSTIDAATTPGVGTVLLSGNYNGPGGFNFVGSNSTVFQLTGTDTYSGVTEITSGTLQTTSANVRLSSSLVIGPTGTLTLGIAAGGFAYANPISGSGVLQLNFANANDAFVIKDSSNFSGVLTLGANGTPGILQTYGGTFGNVNTGAGAEASGLEVGPDLVTGTSLFPFPVGTVLPTTGTVTLGTTTFTGQTTIAPNFTLISGTLAGPVTNSGSFFGTGSGSLVNNGKVGLNPNSAIGSTFAVNGDLTSNAGATILIRASSLTGVQQVDQFTVTGATTLDAASIVRLQGTGNFNNVNQQPILLVAGATTIPIVQSSLLFSPVVGLTGAGLVLTSAVETPTGTYATTANERATAAPLDALIANPNGLSAGQQAALQRIVAVYNGFTSGSQVASELASTSPQSLQYARDIAYETAGMMVQRMGGIDANMRAGYGGLDTSAMSIVNPAFNNGLGKSLKSFFASDSPAFHQSAPNGVNYYPGSGSISDSGSPEAASSSTGSTSSTAEAPAWHSDSQVIHDNPNPYLVNQHPDSPDVPALSEFIAGDAVLAELNQDQGAGNAPSSKAHFIAGDVTAGVGFRVTNHFTAGVLFDYNHADAHTDESGSRTKVDTYSPGIFATYFDHGFYANGLFSFGYNTYKNQRNIDQLGTATSAPDGQQYVTGIDLGYDFHPNKSWVVGPTAGLTYTHLDIDSFTETGADGANLHVDDQSADSLRTRLGGHVIYQTNTGEVLLQPSLGISWQHEFMADSDGITSNFSDLGSQDFTINTIAPSRDSALISLGLDATLSNSMVLYIGYLADVGSSNYYAQSVVAGLKARF